MLKDTKKEFDKVWEKVKISDAEIAQLRTLLDEIKPDIDLSYAEWLTAMKKLENRSDRYDDSAVNEKIAQLDYRLKELEKVCASISQQLSEKKSTSKKKTETEV